jgi:hypothetical protein
MSRFGGAFWFILVLASAMTNFLVKQNVQRLDEELNAVRKKTVAEEKAIHTLTANWTFLNQPEHLADLNNRYIHLSPVAPRQIIATADALPLRPAPPAPPETPPLQLAQLAQLPPALPSSAPPVVPAVAVTTPPAAPIPASLRVHAAAQAPAIPAAASPRSHSAAEAPAAPRPSRVASMDAIFAQVSGER